MHATDAHKVLVEDFQSVVKTVGQGANAAVVHHHHFVEGEHSENLEDRVSHEEADGHPEESSEEVHDIVRSLPHVVQSNVSIARSIEPFEQGLV